MTDRRILVVGGRPQLIRKAGELGLKVIVVQQPEEYDPSVVDCIECALLLDYTDWSQLQSLVATVYEIFPFRSAVSTTEPGLEPAGQVNDMLGLTGISYRSNKLLRDKWAMREHLVSVGMDTIAAELLYDRHQMLDFGLSHGYPFIVKPANAAASLGVTLVADELDVDRAWQYTVGLRGSTEHKFANYFPLKQFLLEEYVPGLEFSVESFSFGRSHVIIAITEKQKTQTGFVEMGHALPARLDEASNKSIIDCVSEFLDTFGVQHGPGHTEVRLSSSGPRIIESHNRTGGDRIVDLVEAVYGVDLESYTAAWPTGVWPALIDGLAEKAAAATRFLTAPSGKVIRIEGATAVRAADQVLDLDIFPSIGDAVQPLRASWDRIGQVLVAGPDTESAVHIADRLAEQVTVVTE